MVESSHLRVGITYMSHAAQSRDHENDRMTETYTIKYRGGAARAGALVQMLQEVGVNVEWETPQERRDLQGIAETVVLSPVASDTWDNVACL
jgi:hypothetical protein